MIRTMTFPLNPFSNRAHARLHGDMRTLLRAATTKASVHQQSAIVSTAAGRLFGFLVVHPGATTPTMTVYDNASAASGRVLREVAAAELVQGAFIYCGPDGVQADDGIYIALGGGTAPTVIAIFEGTYPAVVHAGTVRYFDGTDGDDAWDGTAGTHQGGSVGPKLTMSGTDYDTGDWRLYFKRGTIVEYSRDSSALWAGTDMLLADYGDASYSLPTINVMAPAFDSSQCQFASGATSGVVEFQNVRVNYPGVDARRNGAAFACNRGARLLVSGCQANNFVNGYALGGDYSRIVDSTTATSSQGIIWGSTAHAAPNYSLVFRHQVTETPGADDYSLHDGTGAALGNCVLCSDGSTTNGTGESVFDIQPQFDSGMVAFCTGYGGASTSTPAVVCDDGADNWSFVGNRFVGRSGASGNYLTMLLRGVNPVVVGNYVYGSATNGSASVLGMKSTATGCVVVNNVFEAGAANSAAWSPRQDNLAGSSGRFENNIIISAATSGGRAFIFKDGTNYDAWTLNNNCYYTPNGAKYYDGTTDHSTYAAYIAAAQADAHEAGTVNLNPALTDHYRLPAGSALIGAGKQQAVCYIGMQGVFWQYGQPSIGAYDVIARPA